MIPSWIRQADGLSVAETARELGLTAMSRGTWGPCPACKAGRRGHSDNRGPIGVRGDDKGWRCHRCGASGGALRLVAWATTGQGTCRALWGGTVRSWLVDRGSVVVDAVPVPPRPKLRHPPKGEALDLWSWCGPCASGGYVTRWLESRGLDARAVQRADLVRWLPARNLPDWAAHWPGLGCWAVVQLVDHTGEVWSLQGRAVTDGAPKKSVAAKGVSRSGLVYASPAARMILRVPGERWSRPVVIAEGEPDFLTWAAQGEAVIGIPGGGAWTPKIGARLKDREVVIRCHEDKAGQSYASKILPTLRSAASVHVLAGLVNPDEVSHGH